MTLSLLRRAIESAVMLAMVAGALMLAVIVASVLLSDARRDSTVEPMTGLAVALIVPGAILWWRSRR